MNRPVAPQSIIAALFVLLSLPCSLIGTRKCEDELDCIEPIVQEEVDAYVEEILEYNSGNQATALSGSHLKNPGGVQQFEQQEFVDWQ